MNLKHIPCKYCLVAAKKSSLILTSTMKDPKIRALGTTYAKDTGSG